MTRAAAVVLAADPPPEGEAPTPLWRWDGEHTLIDYHVESLRTAGVDVVVVVLGYGADAVAPLLALDGVEAVAHDRWRSPAANLRAGATALPREAAAALIVDVREPRPPALHRLLLRAHADAGAAAAQPSCRGRAGAPMVVDAAVLAAARNATDDTDPLGGVLRRLGVVPRAVDVDAESAVLRLARPADCALARDAIARG